MLKTKKIKKITVHYFLPCLLNEATARWALNIIEGLDSKKYEVSFVGGKIENSFKNKIPKNISIINLGSTYAVVLLLKLIKHFNKNQPDVFVSAYSHMNIVSLVAKILSKTKTKVVIKECNMFSFNKITARNFFRRIVAKFVLPLLMKIFYPLADSIICVSEGVAEDIYHIIGRKKEIKVIYNSVINRKIYKLSKERVSHPWFKKTKIPIILAVGRLAKEKDYPSLLRAFKLVVKERQVRLVVLGEGSERKKLEQISKKNKISDNVAFLGFQNNPYKYMKRASVFALSSLHEGFGNVIVEAMACGVPVVATDCKSGPGEIIKNKENGILVPVSDDKAMFQAIIGILDDSRLAKKIVQKGTERAKHFLTELGFLEYDKIFSGLIIKRL